MSPYPRASAACCLLTPLVPGSLERDYAKKLSEAAAKSRLQAIKEGPERVGGGKQSKCVPSYLTGACAGRELTGLGGDSTLEAGFMKVLEAADLDAREHLALADALQNKVVDALVSGGTRLEGVRKKHHQFAAKLLAERDRAYSERDKSKQVRRETARRGGAGADAWVVDASVTSTSAPTSRLNG